VRKRHAVVLSEAERARLHTMIGRGVAPASARPCAHPVEGQPGRGRPELDRRRRRGRAELHPCFPAQRGEDQ
jgi:hypothetical protein